MRYDIIKTVGIKERDVMEGGHKKRSQMRPIKSAPCRATKWRFRINLICTRFVNSILK